MKAEIDANESKMGLESDDDGTESDNEIYSESDIEQGSVSEESAVLETEDHTYAEVDLPFLTKLTIFDYEVVTKEANKSNDKELLRESYGLIRTIKRIIKEDKRCNYEEGP